MQVASKVELAGSKLVDAPNAGWDEILAGIQASVKLMQDKMAENEQRQTLMAHEYGMLVRKPYSGYRQDILDSTSSPTTAESNGIEQTIQ